MGGSPSRSAEDIAEEDGGEAGRRTTGTKGESQRPVGTSDERDATGIDRAFRWGVRHPILLVVVALVLVAIVFTVLLNAGPPTEWFA